MKRILSLFLILSSFFLSSEIAAQCDILPDTIYNCGFTVDVEPDGQGFPVFWSYDCSLGDGNITIADNNDGTYTFTFSSCGTYDVLYFSEECLEEYVLVFVIKDPSFTTTSLESENQLYYNNIDCHSDGLSCDNVVTIDGQVPPDPQWDLCYELTCFFAHYSTTSVPADPEFCIADEILVQTINGSDQSSGCQTLEAADVTSENFCQLMDEMFQGAIGSSSCPPATNSCNIPPMNCVDSITYDTIQLLFPVHDGGRWTMLENGDTIILTDTTFVQKYMRDLLFIIDPGAQYYGPGDLTFTLLELVGGDTIPTAFDASFTLWWQELWYYDTIEIVEEVIHPSDDPACLPCGGNSFFASKNIPEIPEYPCAPITISFGTPCSCVDAEIFLTGGNIDCFDPCTILTASVAISADTISYIGEWFGPSGSLGNSDIVTVCEPGLYTFTIFTEPFGCQFEESIIVEENDIIPELIYEDFYTLDCFTECVDIFVDIINPNFLGTVIIVDINGDTEMFNQFPIVITACEEGVISGIVYDDLNGCAEEFFITIVEEFEEISFDINPPEILTCELDCTTLSMNNEMVPAGSIYQWIGPNGFTSTSSAAIVCEQGDYQLTVIYGNCIYSELVTVVEQTEVYENFEIVTICSPDCYFFQGELICESGTYFSNESCDSIYNLELTVINNIPIDYNLEICEGDSAEVNGVFYYTSGNYVEYVFDPNSDCEQQINIDVDVLSIDVSVTGSQEVNCLTPFTTLEAASVSSFGTTFEWYDALGNLIGNGSTYTFTQAGTYSVVGYETSTGCQAQESFLIIENFDVPDLAVEPQASIHCDGFIQLQSTVDPSQNLDILWAGPGIDGSQVFLQNPIVTEAGTYVILVTDPSGCTNVAEVEVLTVEPIDVLVESEESCLNEDNGVVKAQVFSGGVGPFMYSIDDGSFQNSGVFENVEPGIHDITVMNDDGCEHQESILVETIEPLEPSFEIASAYELCETPNLRFDLSDDLQANDNWTYQWSDGYQAADRNIQDAGSYSLTLENECELREFIFEVADSRLQEDLPMYVANMFSPNGDGLNDVFQIHAKDIPAEFSVDIYDRWGNMVFQSDNIMESWDGIVNGQAGKSDVYAYIVKYSHLECNDQEKEFTIIGDVTIIR